MRKTSRLQKKKDDVHCKRYAYWKKKADKAWSELIRKPFGGCCRVCNTPHPKLNAHHLLCKEQYPRYRYDLSNGIPLCPMTCHKRFAHGRAVDWVLWLQKKQPDLYAWAVERRCDTGYGSDPIDYRHEYEALQAVLEGE